MSRRIESDAGESVFQLWSKKLRGQMTEEERVEWNMLWKLSDSRRIQGGKSIFQEWLEKRKGAKEAKSKQKA